MQLQANFHLSATRVSVLLDEDRLRGTNVQFEEILCGPEWPHLHRIVKGESLTLISGFYGGPMLNRLCAALPGEGRLLVRLPNPGLLPRVLPNDPRPLLSLARKRPKLSIFVDPVIHAKLYTSSHGALLGSANLSDRGFSGRAEAALFTAHQATVKELQTSAQKFIDGSRKVDEKYLEQLVTSLEDGRTRVEPPPEDASAMAEENAGQAGNPPFAAFREWLSVQKSDVSKEAYERCTGKFNLHGHAYTAYHGLAVMFRSDPGWARQLSGQDWQGARIERGIERIREFIKNNPGAVRGKVSATWETYLPASLGGKVQGGGAAIGLIKMMMSLIPTYLASIKLI